MFCFCSIVGLGFGLCFEYSLIGKLYNHISYLSCAVPPLMVLDSLIRVVFRLSTRFERCTVYYLCKVFVL